MEAKAGNATVGNATAVKVEGEEARVVKAGSEGLSLEEALVGVGEEEA